MIFPLLKAKKSFFNSRGVIIAINGKNAIEAKREANKSIFSIVRVIRTDLFFYIVYDFGFDVVFKKGINPFRSFIFRLPFTGNRFFIKTAYFSKFFYSEFALFKFIFKLLIIHFQPLKVKLVELYQKISYLWRVFLLTLKLLLVYNLSVKVTIVY